MTFYNPIWKTASKAKTRIRSWTNDLQIPSPIQWTPCYIWLFFTLKMFPSVLKLVIHVIKSIVINKQKSKVKNMWLVEELYPGFLCCGALTRLNRCYENLLNHRFTKNSFCRISVFTKNSFRQISVFTENLFCRINDSSKCLT